MTADSPSEKSEFTNGDVQAAFAAQPIIATIEVDRFCGRCGYNLRTQPVRREPRTELLLCRCPECGQFDAARDGATAGRVWLNRLGTAVSLAWIVGLLGIVLGIGGAQTGISFGVLDETTMYAPLPATTTTLPAGQVANYTSSNSRTGMQTVSTVTKDGVQTVTTMKWACQPRDVDTELRLFIWFMRTLSFGLGFTLILLIAVAAHHWPRWTYYVPVIALAAAACGLARIVAQFEMPELGGWAWFVISTQTAAFLVGGACAVPTARPLARLAATIVLPLRWRQVVAFLWLADGKLPPGGGEERQQR